MSATIIAEGLAEAAVYFQRLPDIAAQSARMAINDTAGGKGLKILRLAIYKQIEFPAGYVNTDRLYVSKKATNADLEARVTARMRPTSLARFAPGQTPAGTRGKGVRVSVQPGSSRTMKSAFLVRLRAGATLNDENFNIGLAVRLKPGERIFNKRAQSGVQLGHNLYLLYGPSVDQVFREVAEDQSPEILSEVETEFLRQFARLSDAA